MNIFQSLNAASFFCIVVALLTGVKDQFSTSQTSIIGFLVENNDLIAFMLFYVALKVKITFDDHAHFAEEVDPESAKYRTYGFWLAVISWILWIISGYLASNLRLASSFLAFSLTVSTMWIIVHLVEVRNKNLASNSKSASAAEQLTISLRQGWVITNFAYIILLGLHSQSRPSDGYYPFILLFLCNIVLFCDIIFSDPIDRLFKKR